MGRLVPQGIRRRIVEYYFTTPNSMGWIAQKCGISKSSVFNIVNAKMAEDPDFTVMRYMVVNLGKNGIDVPKYASAIRIQNLLKEYGIDADTGESIMEKILTMCYREHWDPTVAIAALKRFEEGAREWGMTPREYETDQLKSWDLMRSYHAQIDKEREMLNSFINNNKSLGAYYGLLCAAGGPSEILAATHDAKIYKEKYYKLLNDTRQARMDKSIDKRQLDKLNKRLGRNAVGKQQILEKLEDIRLEPAKYWYLFDEDLLYLRSDLGAKPEYYDPSQTQQVQNDARSSMGIEAQKPL
jgi:hypothetical protein